MNRSVASLLVTTMREGHVAAVITAKVNNNEHSEYQTALTHMMLADLT
jgi:hypothetical protein